jgi:hypothetical protein
MIETVIKIIMCHAVGDYLFQTDYMAAAKGKDWYVLFIHCLCYCVPFAVVFGIDWRLVVMLAVHVITDALKARYNLITLTADQFVHYVTAMLFLFA